MKKSVKDLRKEVKEGIQNGSITTYNLGNTKSISRLIAYLSKDQLIDILDNRLLNLKDDKWNYVIDKSNYDPRTMHTQNVSGNAKGGSKAKSNNTNGKSNANNSSDDDCESCNGSGKYGSDHECEDCNGTGKLDISNKLPKKTGANNSSKVQVSKVDYKVITDTRGGIELQTLRDDLNIEQANMSQTLQDDVVDLTERVNDNASRVTTSNNILTNILIDTDRKLEDMLELAKSVRTIDININGAKSKLKKEHLHPKFEDILKYSKLDKNVMLVGEAGTGKTTICGQVAKALNVEFSCASCTSGMTESTLQGYMTAKGEYIETDFLRIFENGGVFLLDEFDACDSNMLVIINSALANGVFSVPKRQGNTQAFRHDDCVIIACGNTYGTGAGSRKYNGRNAIDSATLDRFTTIEFDYDRALERKLIGDFDYAYKFLNSLRLSVKSNNLNRVVSTRQFVKANRHLSNDISFEKFANSIVVSWSDMEKAKVNFNELVETFSPRK